MDPLIKIKSMTSNTGVYQHGKLSETDPVFGYALEDQARALIVAYDFNDENLQKIYMDFILRAQRNDGLLYHFYYENTGTGSFKNSELDSKPNMEEAYGIVLWSILHAKKNENENIQRIAQNLIENAFGWTSPRAISTGLLGLLNLEDQDSLENELIKRLHDFYFYTHSNDWEWFEDYLVYANAIISWAMWETYIRRKCDTSFEIARKTTEFLITNCHINNIPAPIGNKGWYFRGKKKALFDQQPIDSGYMVCCLERAYNATGNLYYLEWAEKWYNWFLGFNTGKIPLVDKNYACFDALTAEGVNLNQGAESNICFLMAYLAARRMGFAPGI